MSIRVDSAKCTGCKLCIKACPQDAITVAAKLAVIDLDKCNYCGLCIEACKKFQAITIEKKRDSQSAQHIKEYKCVAVFIEQREGKIAGVSYEMLGEGRKLADELGEELVALLFGHNMHDAAHELVKYGADKVYYQDGPDLKQFKDDTYAGLTSDFIKSVKPTIFIGGATAIGRSFIPKVAAKVKGGLTADCTKLEIDREKKLLLGTRPAFGGNLMATITCPDHRPQMATVRHKVMKPAVYNPSRKGEVIIKTIEENSIPERTRVIKFIEEGTSVIKIEEADIIVTAGRELGSPDNIAHIKVLAEILEGAIGASRAAVDAGWLPYSHQIGQTGKTVCPKLYIACGVSGAIQHMVGMQSSDYIIAINKDPNAEIFQIASLGIVGDAREILPKLTKRLKEELGK